MIEKQIKKHLYNKINKWLKTIDNQELVALIKRDLLITGGAITNLITSDMPNDYDCYFKTKETVLAVAKYYVDLWNEKHGKIDNKIGYKSKVMILDADNPSNEILDYYNVGDVENSRAVMVSNVNVQPGQVKIIFPSDGIVEDTSKHLDNLDEYKLDKRVTSENGKYEPVFMSSNAISLSDGIQLIVRFYGSSNKIHTNFDFEHAKGVYEYTGDVLTIPSKVYECVINKRLLYTGSLYPLASMFRMRKFIKREWHISVGEILKIALQISELDLYDVNILEEQLIGVDTLYFTTMLDHLRRDQKENEHLDIDQKYLVSVIDKVFGD